jgi:WD40 repeat protein
MNINNPSVAECKAHQKPIALICSHPTCISRLLCLSCLRSHEGSHNSNYIDLEEFISRDPLSQIDKIISDLELKEKSRVSKVNSLLCEIECLFSAVQEMFSKRFNDLKERIVNRLLHSQTEDTLNTRLAERIANSRGDLYHLYQAMKPDGQNLQYDELSGFIHKFYTFQKHLQDETESLNPANFIDSIDNDKKQVMLGELEDVINKNLKIFEQDLHYVIKKRDSDEHIKIKPDSIHLQHSLNHEQIGGCWIQCFAQMKINGVSAAICGDDKGNLKIWDLTKHTLLFELKEKKGEKSKICSILAYPKTAQVAIAYGNQIKIFDLHPNFSLQLNKILNHHKCDVYSMEPLESSIFVMSAEWDNDSKKLCMWRMDSGALKQEVQLKFGCYSLRKLIGRDWVAIGHWKGTITIFDLDKQNTLKESQFLVGHNETVVDFAWENNSRMLFSSSDDMTIRQWYLPLGRCVKVFDLKKDKAGSLLLFYESDFIVSTSFEGLMKVFKISTAELTYETPVTQGFRPMLIGLKNKKQILTRDKTHIKTWTFTS